MKKLTSAVSAILVCAFCLCIFGSCGKSPVPKKEKEIIEELAVQDYKLENLDMEKLNEFTAQGADSKSENSLYVDNENGNSIIVNKKKGDALSVGFVITDAVYKDIDGDGTDEIYALGPGDVDAGLKDVVTVALFKYMDNSYKDKALTECIGYSHFPDSLTLGFVDKGSDGVHLVSFSVNENGEKSIIKDYGALSQNGILLETPETSIKEKTASPDMSIFQKRDGVKFMHDGKEFDPGEDFIFQPFEGDQSIYLNAETLEKVTGVKLRTDIDNILKSIIITVYGKRYINALIVDKYMDLKTDYSEAFCFDSP